MEQSHKTLIVRCAVVAIVAGLIFLGYMYLVDPVTVNYIKPDPGYLNSSPISVSQTFSFEKGNVTIMVPVNLSVYEGAKTTDKGVFSQPGIPFTTWESESARTMIQDPVQDELFSNLLREFRKVRSEQNLTDDEYAELLTAYVQSIDYHATDDPAKYPVETVYDRQGDCDDKSLLLAGLLSREGYKVSLLLFEDKHHMVVGIGSDDNLYLDTGYAYVDIMDYSFIGVPVNRLKGAKDYFLNPIVIPVGTGTKIYHSGGETRYISDMVTLADNRSGTFALQMKGIPPDTPENISAYTQDRNEFLASSTIYTYVIHHRFDRPGVYEYLKENPVDKSGAS
jgi:predicted RNA-binding protein associated with RNAse of E/G family